MKMTNTEILKRIRSVKLLLLAHPDNVPESEFEDRINDLIDIEESIIDKCDHPFAKVASLGTLHNCLNCGENIK